MQENNPSQSGNIIPIHLVSHRKSGDMKIDFEFNTAVDSLDTVASELIDTLGMTEADKPTIISLIEQQINSKTSSSVHTEPFFEPISFDSHYSDQSDDTSDDADITDPRYRSLIEQQKRDMDQLLAKHLAERRELAQRINASVIHQIQQQNQAQPIQPQQGQSQPQPQQIQPQPPNSAQLNPPKLIPPGSQPQQAPSASPIPIMNPPSTSPPKLCDDLIDFK